MRNVDMYRIELRESRRIRRLGKAPLRLFVSDSATCISAIYPPTGYPRSAMYSGQSQHVHLVCTLSHATCSDTASTGIASGAINQVLNLARPLPAFGCAIHISPSPWHHLGLPHNASTRGCRPGIAQVTQTYSNHLHHGGKRRKDRERVCMRAMQKTQSALCSFRHRRVMSKVSFSGHVEALGMTRAADVRKQELNASNTSRDEDQLSRAARCHRQIGCATSIKKSTSYLPSSRLWRPLRRRPRYPR
jgi:hypothetical protein